MALQSADASPAPGIETALEGGMTPAPRARYSFTRLGSNDAASDPGSHGLRTALGPMR
jgi:hypothetical protein